MTRDDVPPEVLIVTPADGSIGVLEDALIRVGFSEPIDPASVDGDSVSLVAATGMVTGSSTLILGNTALVFTPDTPLAYRYGVYFECRRGIRCGWQHFSYAVHVHFLNPRHGCPDRLIAVTVPAGARLMEAVIIQALVSGNDIASVDFLVDGSCCCDRENA